MDTEHTFANPVTIADFQQRLSQFPTKNPLVDAHSISMLTVSRIMGADWFTKWFIEFMGENKLGMYFRPHTDPDDQHVVHRQIRFAELLFNLQRLHGFNARVAEWQGHGPEAVVGELESAFYMMSCGHFPSFRIADRSAGKTHDFDVVLSWGAKCVWESKAKRESVHLAAKPLIRSLQAARHQLAKDRSNIILLRIPEQWAVAPGFEAIIEDVVHHLFRNSPERSISVLFHWELWSTEPERMDNHGLSGFEIVNLRWDIVMGGRRVMDGYRGFPDGWLRFQDWCARQRFYPQF